MEYEYDTISEAFVNLLYEIKADGDIVPVGREHASGKITREICPCHVRIGHPRNRTLLVNGRNSNPFAQMFETLWVLSGTNELGALKIFLPKAGEWSDDGKTWRAAYGPRLRYAVGLDDVQYERFRAAMIVHNRAVTNFSVSGFSAVDQLKYVANELQNDPTSRRAVMTIWDPAKECTIEKSRDFPCSNHIQFLIRGGKLDCHVTMRSNDLWFGFGSVNVYEFSVMQEIIANVLGISVGAYYHNANSLHVYEEMLDKFDPIFNGKIFSLLKLGVKPFAWSKDLLHVSVNRGYVNTVQKFYDCDTTELVSALKQLVDSDSAGTILFYLLLYVLFLKDKELLVKNYPLLM